jgi:DNA-binding response OmpR family regulator
VTAPASGARFVVRRNRLSTQGYEVLEAANCKSSLELMARKPDLIILDLGLPDIAGIEMAGTSPAMTIRRAALTPP